jgi:hypothetical protein
MRLIDLLHFVDTLIIKFSQSRLLYCGIARLQYVLIQCGTKLFSSSYLCTTLEKKEGSTPTSKYTSKFQKKISRLIAKQYVFVAKNIYPTK